MAERNEHNVCRLLKKASDSIHRNSLWRILCAYGIPTYIVDLSKPFYENYTCTIRQSDITFMVKCDVSSLTQHCHRLDYEEDNRRTKYVFFSRGYFNQICHPSQRPRWQVDKEAIGLSRVQQCSSTYNPPS